MKKRRKEKIMKTGYEKRKEKRKKNFLLSVSFINYEIICIF